jgi:transposase-like protein
MTRKQDSPKAEAWKAALTSVVKEENFLRPLVEQIVQQILEAETDETLGAEKNERTPNRDEQFSGH